jgi:hypothetical protein
MSGSAENTASSASEKPERRDVVLNLATANRMLPLVRQIVADIVQCHQDLARLRPEQNRLDRNRFKLSWPLRQRRYEVQEETTIAEQNLLDAFAELEVLGLTLENQAAGQIGFPTLVNDRKAYFSWKIGENGIQFWHFAGESQRRPVPATWAKSADIRLLNKS